MKVLKGIAAASGFSKGTACFYTEKAAEDVPHYILDKDRIEPEISRFKEAINKAKDTMHQMIEASKKLLDKRAQDIFNVHLMILDDPVLSEKITGMIRKKLINAEHAVNDAFEEYIKTYQMSDMHFAELAHDTMDVRNRILFSFSGLKGGFECPIGDRQAVIVVSKRLTPSMVLSIPREHVMAFVTQEGGFTTHATILARGFNIPVIFGIDVEDNIGCGDILIVDGTHGKVFVKPDKNTIDEYERKMAEARRKAAVCEIKKEEPSGTRRGIRVKLKANISIPGEVELLKGLHYDGIGLLRTEFLFVGKELPPGEDEQFAMYRYICDEAGGRDVSVRLLDIGCDKMPEYLHLPPQDNPDLGIRGARSLDFFYDIYLAQAKAVLRASEHGNIRILFPMVSDLNDVRSFKDLISNAKSVLKKEGKAFGRDLKEGIMIETPSAALMARALLEEVDFANIGSNDLLQYTLGASRGHVAVEKRYHIMHPALVRLLEEIVKQAGRCNKELCLCGEIASFDEYYPFLLGVGLRSFSVAASRLAHIKCELMHHRKLKRSEVNKIYRAVTIEDVNRVLEKK